MRLRTGHPCRAAGVARGVLSRRTNRTEHGVVAGADGLAFGMLILVSGAVLIINLWAMIDTRVALDGAAREYLRTYTEQADLVSARVAAELAVERHLSARGTRMGDVSIFTVEPNGFGPCALIGVRVSATSEWITVPFIGSYGNSKVTVEHREMVDAHREILVDDRYQRSETLCAAD